MSTVIKVPLKLPAGFLINVKFLGQALVVPPADIELPINILLPAALITIPIADIVNPIKAAVAGVPQAVVDLLWTPINKQLADYYEVAYVEEKNKEEGVPPIIPPAAVHICPICGRVFATAADLSTHIVVDHPGRVY